MSPAKNLTKGHRPSSAKRAILAAAVLALAAFIPALSPSPARAVQGIGTLSNDTQDPLEIHADDGIEWLQDKKMYIARGNASAIKGDLTVNADVLTAHYRETSEGGTDIWRLDADGNVKILSPTSVTTADRGIFDLTKGILVLTGRNLKLQAGDDTVTAKDSLEYWQAKNMAVARGAASAIREGKRINADVLTAYFKDKKGAGKSSNGSENTDIQRIEAFGNVKIKTPTEVATSKRGVYNVETGIASIFGSVNITRGNDALAGEYGEVNLNTGISKLLNTTPGGKTKGRVRAVFSPKKKTVVEPEKKTPGAGTP